MSKPRCECACASYWESQLSDSQAREAMLTEALKKISLQQFMSDPSISRGNTYVDSLLHRMEQMAECAKNALSQSPEFWLKREKAKAEAKGLFTLWQILEISRIAAAVNGDENTKRAIENIKTEAKRRAAALEAEAGE